MIQTLAIRKTSRGFTLLELLLTIALITILLSGLYKIFDNWSARAVNRVAATDMLRLQTAAEDYVMANFDALKNDSPNAFVEININALRNGGFLPPAYEALNVFKQRMRVFRRNIPVNKKGADGNDVIDPITGVPEVIVTTEVMTLSDNPSGIVTVRVDDMRLFDTAKAGGPKMGVVSNKVLAGRNFANSAASIYNSWQVPLSPDLNSAGYTATPNAADGGYLAVYSLVNTETMDPNSEWLYRVAITNRPELNRMQADLNMNGNRMENVGTIVADKVSVTGNAAFRGLTQGATSQTAQAMTIEQALRVEGAGESRINMKDTRDAPPASCEFTDVGGGNRTVGAGCDMGGGELQVISPVDNASLNTRRLISDGNVVTDITNVAQTTSMDGVSTFTNVTGTGLQAAGTVLSPNITVNGNTVSTEQMQTASMDVQAGVNVTNRLVAAQITPTTVQTTAMDALNAVNLTGNLIASSARATESLYIEDVRAPSNYTDTVLNRPVTCSIANGRTYCEPLGWTDWSNGVSQLCSANGTGYSCSYHRPGRGPQFGSCIFTRTVSGDGRAIHTSNCS